MLSRESLYDCTSLHDYESGIRGTVVQQTLLFDIQELFQMRELHVGERQLYNSGAQHNS